MASVKATVKDLEQFGDLDAWLRTTDRVRKNHGLPDAWAIGDTDCAFRINNVTGVQRSHRANDWNYWPGDLAQRYHDNGQNYGTYLNLQTENMIEEVIGQTPWKITADRSQKYDNRAGEVELQRKTTAEQSETTVKEVTVTNAVAVELEAGFKAYGADIKITCKYDHTDARMNSVSTTIATGEEATITVPAGKYVELHTVTKECEKRYRVRFPIVMEGWVGLCTAGAQDNWNTILPLTDPNDLDATKGLSFVSKDWVTRWLSLEMNVASTETEVIVHGAPTDTSVTEAQVHEKLNAAK